MRIGDREIKRVGLGTNRLENTDGGRSFLRDAVAAGLDFVDTAHLYTSGESERAIGAASLSGVAVATKAGFNDQRPDKIRAEVEQSLQSLETDSIFLLYLHRVGDRVPIEESLGALGDLQRQGKIEHIGISEVGIGQIDRARQVVEVAAVQNEFSLGERKHDEVVDYCRAERIPFVPFFPLRGGGSAVEEIASARAVSANQIKIAWLLRRSETMAPIPGTLSIEHLSENLAALELELEDHEFDALSAA